MSGPAPNLLDRAIAAISPSWAESRMKARHVFEVNRVRAQLLQKESQRLERLVDRRNAEEARYFEGAESDPRRTYGWQTANRSPTEGMVLDLQVLRDRSRYLYFADDYFSGAVEGFIQQSIGKGVAMQSLVPPCKAKGGVPEITEATAEDCRETLEQAWKDQAEEITKDGLEFAEFLEQNLWHERVDGAGVSIIFDEDRRDRPTSLSLEVIDPWLVGPPPGADVKTNPLGVETQNGRPVRVHYRKGYASVEYDSVPADRMPVAFRRRWANHHLGLPWIFAGNGRCFDIKTMRESELISAEIATCFALHIQTAGSLGAGEETVPDSTGLGWRRFKNLRPGQIIVGEPGDVVTPINPNRPGSNFSPFMEVNLRGLGAGLNYPYEYLSNDFSKTTYLSGRMSQILGRESFRGMQWVLARRLCKPIWRAFVARMVVAKLLPISARQYAANRIQIERVFVQPRGWMWIDPNKDVSAAIDGYQHGMTTLKDVWDAQGEDSEEKLDQWMYERKKWGIGVKPDAERRTPVKGRLPRDPDDIPEDDEDG